MKNNSCLLFSGAPVVFAIWVARTRPLPVGDCANFNISVELRTGIKFGLVFGVEFQINAGSSLMFEKNVMFISTSWSSTAVAASSRLPPRHSFLEASMDDDLLFWKKSLSLFVSRLLFIGLSVSPFFPSRTLFSLQTVGGPIFARLTVVVSSLVPTRERERRFSLSPIKKCCFSTYPACLSLYRFLSSPSHYNNCSKKGTHFNLHIIKDTLFGTK